MTMLPWELYVHVAKKIEKRQGFSELSTYAILTSFLTWSRAEAILQTCSVGKGKLYIHQQIEYYQLASFSLVENGLTMAV